MIEFRIYIKETEPGNVGLSIDFGLGANITPLEKQKSEVAKKAIVDALLACGPHDGAAWGRDMDEARTKARIEGAIKRAGQ